MADPALNSPWAFRALFLGLALGVVFVQVLPFRIGDARWPGPDILMLLAFAWVMRRPDYVPVAMVALVILFTDILFMRPLGLWTALVLLGFEFLRARQPFSRDLPFLVEWVMVSAVISGITLANALILTLFLVERPVLTLTMMQMAISILAYPVVVVVSRYMIGVRKATPGELGATGQRL